MFLTPPPTTPPPSLIRQVVFDLGRRSPRYRIILSDPSHQTYEFYEGGVDEQWTAGHWVAFAGGGGGDGDMTRTYDLGVIGGYDRWMPAGEREVVTITTTGTTRTVPIRVIRVR